MNYSKSSYEKLEKVIQHYINEKNIVIYKTIIAAAVVIGILYIIFKYVL